MRSPLLFTSPTKYGRYLPLQRRFRVDGDNNGGDDDGGREGAVIFDSLTD